MFKPPIALIVPLALIFPVTSNLEPVSRTAYPTFPRRGIIDVPAVCCPLSAGNGRAVNVQTADGVNRSTRIDVSRHLELGPGCCRADADVGASRIKDHIIALVVN